MIRMTEMVKHLLIINIIFFATSYLLPASNDLFALHYFESDKFKFWQPLTRMFMHDGFLHLFFNMFALVSFGSALEFQWGNKKFLFFYLSCGIGAMLLDSAVKYYLFHKGLDILVLNGFEKQGVLDLLSQKMEDTRWQEYLSPSVYDNMLKTYFGMSLGASGAIYGLLVAFAYMYPEALLGLMFIPVPVKAKYFVPIILSLDLFLGINGGSIFGGISSGIGHFAHLGGALTGFIMVWYWKKNQFNDKRWN